MRAVDAPVHVANGLASARAHTRARFYKAARAQYVCACKEICNRQGVELKGSG